MQENEVAMVPEPVTGEQAKEAGVKTERGVNVQKIGVTFEEGNRLEVIEMDNASIVIAKSGLTIYSGPKGVGGVALGMAFNAIESGEKLEMGKSQFIASVGSNRPQEFDYMRLHNGITLLLHKDRVVISTSSRNSLQEIHPGTGIVTLPLRSNSLIILPN